MLTLSYFCSLLRLAKPPQKREEPRTRRRFERMEPRREYLTTSILCSARAKIAIMSSVALPQVAFKSPPTVKPKRLSHYRTYLASENQLTMANFKEFFTIKGSIRAKSSTLLSPFCKQNETIYLLGQCSKQFAYTTKEIE